MPAFPTGSGHLRSAAAVLPVLAALAACCVLAPGAAAKDARQKQQIVFAEPPARAAGDAPFDLVAKATSGLPVAFVLISGPAVLDGRKLRLTGEPGLVIIRATQKGNDEFQPAVPAERAFSVAARPSAPAIRVQPAGTLAGVGEAVMLSVEASGEPPPGFQWRKDGSPLAGATGRTLTIPSAAPTDAGNYDVVATNASGSATSDRARVAVGRRQQTIYFQGPTMVFAGQPAALSVSASSGLPVRLQVVSGAATISGTMMTAQAGTTVVVQATQPGDATYEAAVPVTQSFAVGVGQDGQHVP